jgi:hypothetical protein
VCLRVRPSFRLEAKQCEKGSEQKFASKRNKGLVLLVLPQSETVTFGMRHKAKNSKTKQIFKKIPYWIEE